MLANFGYWCGIWITLSFVIFALLNTFVLNKKNDFKNQIVIAALLPFTFLLTYLILPEAVGEGLFFLVRENFSTISILFSVLLFGASFYYLVSEKHFFKTCRYLAKIFTQIFDAFKNINYESLFKTDWKKTLVSQKDKLVLWVGQLRRSEVAPVSTSPTKKFKVTAAPQIEEVEELKSSAEEEEVDLLEESDELLINDSEIDEPEEEFEEEESPFILEKEKKDDKFFESDELIDCIVARNQPHQFHDPDNGYFETIARSIEEKLKEFSITAHIINVLKGPVVDTFELELGAGVKVAGVINRTDDLSLALKGAPIRMVYPMKGRTTIGIEVPRNPRALIYLDEVLSSPSFKNSSHRLPIAMGRDAYGEAAFIDLASTPHFLVAGTTGSGKSVFVNTLLVSLIIKLSPKKLKLILIDPKQLELATYASLPHLIMPVVTDPQIASISLMWAIEEMERRYSILKDFGVKNIEGFNKKILTAGPELTCKINKYYPDAETQDFELPYIVIVVDEFADLKLSKSGPAIETSISRLAAKARASGIHIVLATQRPSTDVITGVIKANFPTRVAFRVTTNMDSRVILDTMGAEKLLGRGDMLYKQGIETLRMHSAYVDEEEIDKLVQKLAGLPIQYDSGAMEFIQNNGVSDDDVEGITTDGEGGGLKDEKYDEAVRCVATHRLASASMLQRRLGVGYNRAANLIEEMERHGVVGPAQGSKPRKVLVPPPSDSTP